MKESETGKPIVGLRITGGCDLQLTERRYLSVDFSLIQKSASYTAREGGDTIVTMDIPNVGPVDLPADYTVEVNGDLNNYYAELGISYLWKFRPKTHLYLGIEVSKLIYTNSTGRADVVIGDNFSYDTTYIDNKNDITKWTYGINFGVRQKLGKRFMLDWKSGLAFNSVFRSSYTEVSGTYRNFYFQPTLIFTFGKTPRICNIKASDHPRFLRGVKLKESGGE